jgi:hypothetical protein
MQTPKFNPNQPYQNAQFDPNSSYSPIATEESEHARQLSPGMAPPSRPLDRLLAPSDMTGNDPNTLRGYLKTWAEFGKGAGRGIADLVASPPPGTKENPVIWNPITQLKKDWQGLKNLHEEYKTNPNYVAGELAGPALLTHAVSQLLTPVGMASKLTRATGVSDASMIEEAVGDLRSAAKVSGKPNTLGGFLDNVSLAEKNLNTEYANTLGKYAVVRGNLPDSNGKFPLSDAIRKLKDRMPKTTTADRAARSHIDAVASEFEKPIPLGELDLKRMQANGRLFSYEKMNDTAQYSAESRNADIAVDKTVADWVRDNVYPEMDHLTGKPQGYFRNLKQRVGNLMNIESETKGNASKLHTSSMRERGMTRWERSKPGATMSEKGSIRAYFPNIPAWFKASDPEAAANNAVRSAYGLHQMFTPPPEMMSVPVANFLAAIRARPTGSKTQQLQRMADEQRNGAQ